MRTHDGVQNYENYDPYIALANAIVIQAVDEYERAYGYLLLQGLNPAKDSFIQRMENWFKSEWCNMLTDANMDYVVMKIQKMTKEKLDNGKLKKERRYRSKCPCYLSRKL